METSSLEKLAHVANTSEDLQMSKTSNASQYSNLVKQEDSNGALHHRAQLSKSDSKRTRRLACTCCRQQKSKCDAQTRYPLPCTRCATKGLTCELNAEFKRTEKRARLALFEREFAEFKRSIHGPLAAADFLRTAQALGTLAYSGSPPPELPMSFTRAIPIPQSLLSQTSVPNNLPIINTGINQQGPIQEIALSSSLDSPRPVLKHSADSGAKSCSPLIATPQANEYSVPESALICEEKSVEDITLSPELIRSLFLEYVNKYHPILPIVDITRGPERIYRLCPALFWVIINITLRRYNSDKSLLLRLSPLVKNILAEISISPIARYNPTEEDDPIMNSCSVYSVQAFVLYSMWPPLTSSLSADSSWSTIGVALFQAIRIGLHTSSLLLDQYSGNEEQVNQYSMAQEQMRTWIICNTVSQNIASAFGYPAFVQFDFLSAKHCNLSISTHHIMEIAQFEDQVCKTLSLATLRGSSQTSERLALLKVLANQLDDLELKVVSECSQENGYRKLQFILARIHLLSYYFLDAEHLSSLELSKGLVRLYNASISLIEHVQMCQAKNSRFVEYLPAVSILSIWQGSFFVVKLANSPMKSVIDVNIAREAYGVAVDLVAKASILKHDISYRASGIMRNMWQFFNRLDAKNQLNLQISIKSRMAASVFFDCLSLLRDKVGLAKLNIKTDVRKHTDSNEEDGGISEEESEPGFTGKGGTLTDDDTISANALSTEKTATGESQSNTPGSFGSSGRAKKKRQLSDNEDPDSTARRIIRTIPLDPQPISASKRSTIFKVVNGSNHTSPNASVKSDELNGPSHLVPQIIGMASSTEPALKNGKKSKPYVESKGSPLSSNMIFSHDAIQERSRQQDAVGGDLTGIFEDDLFINHDLIWKDVDSLMNDFGFHA